MEALKSKKITKPVLAWVSGTCMLLFTMWFFIHTHADSVTLRQNQTHMHAHAHSCTLTHTHAHTCTHMHMHTHMHARAHLNANMNAHSGASMFPTEVQFGHAGAKSGGASAESAAAKNQALK